ADMRACARVGFSVYTKFCTPSLRPVYGFDGIELTSKDQIISINVQRKAERLRPADYFSQSQVQTLILGLFLTACSSQTWSGFSSIMMDDPVTHFDDLNTYALLDLILGLQSSSEGERQFVISTCDENCCSSLGTSFGTLGPRPGSIASKPSGQTGEWSRSSRHSPLSPGAAALRLRLVETVGLTGGRSPISCH
ncbi:hypothetical protein, partial [Acidovorax sp. SRB_24]|uniref:hypothetical protein n=1 Tax=Acidovorax sp. SRB_24 TaxID=1962700 RepID=UPI00197C155E